MQKNSNNRHILFLILLTFTSAIYAQDLPTYSFSLKGGFSVNDYGSDFTHLEGVIDYRLPTAITIKDNFEINIAASLTTGLMSSRNRNGILIAAGPKFLLKVIKTYLVISLSTAPAYLTRDIYKEFSIGGKFHFLSQIGLNLFMHRKFSIVYNFQHISNAGFEKPNPGVNFHMIGMRYNIH